MEDKGEVLSHKVEQRDEKLKKKKKTRKPEDQIKQSNVQTPGVPERENRDYTLEEITDEIIQEIFL